MQRLLLRVLGSSSILTGCLMILFHDRMLQQVLVLAAPVFSPDGEISSVGFQNLHWSLNSAAVVASFAGGALWTLAMLEQPVQAWFIEVFSDEGRHPAKRKSFWMLSGVGISIVLGVVVSLALENPDQTDLEDTWIENLQVVLLATSAFLLIPTAIRARKAEFRFAALVGGVYAVCSFLLALVFLEEISWGQRIFGWETPAYWSQVNAQQETNLHNLLNQFFVPLYLAFGIGFVIVTLLSISEKTLRKSRNWLGLLLPHPAFFFSAVVFASFNVFPIVGAVLPWGEFQEFLLYVCVVLYAWEKRQSVKA